MNNEKNPPKRNFFSADEITVNELKSVIDDKEDFELVDVREEFEYGICKINGAKLMPLNQLIKNNDLGVDKNKQVILYCHHGNRSAIASEILKNKGYKKVKNLVGGIDAWAREIDSSVAVY